MKKLLCLLLAALMLSCTACGKTPTDSQQSTEQTADSAASANTLDTENGTLKFIGMEKTNDKILTEKTPNVWIFKYEFTNKTSEPKECQNLFEIKCFQNNVETSDVESSYSSEGGEQYDLISNYFLETLKGGTITFGRFVQLTDESPVTIYLSEKKSENSVSFTVDVKEETTNTPEGNIVSADKVSKDLLGEWKAAPGKGNGTLTFTESTVTMVGDNNLTITGTYEIKAEESYVYAEFTSSDNKLVKVKFHYKYENDKLIILNDAGEDTFIK